MNAPIKTIESPDGRREVRILQHSDGTFGFQEHERKSREQRWIALDSRCECQARTAGAAEEAAMACVDWLDDSMLHVAPTDVAHSYDRIAKRWLDTGLSRNGIAPHERALAFRRRTGFALDIGCGCSGRITDLLLRHGYRVEGIDLSSEMIELAKRRQPGVAFLQADIREWRLPREYDFITAWDSVWHVPLAEQENVLRKMLQGLAPGGTCIFTTPGLDGPAEKIDFAMGQPMYYSGPGIPRLLELIAESQCVCRHLEYDQHPELHVHLIVQRKP